MIKKEEILVTGAAGFIGFHTCIKLLRLGKSIIGFDNIPVFTTSVIDKKGSPYLGVGEVVAGPTGAAISNALCKALGQRIKILPFTKDNITKELLN